MWQYLGSNAPVARVLPEIDESQMYFISVGQVFCSQLRPELSRVLTSTNAHAPSRIRVNAVMANSELFSSAFQCPSGSPMNPVRKCDLWKHR